jgi:hypothetical protein
MNPQLAYLAENLCRFLPALGQNRSPDTQMRTAGSLTQLNPQRLSLVAEG